MRATFPRWSWIVVTSCCLVVTVSSGCKSGFKAPGADWFTWGKPKPSTSALASVPKKPSAGALPTPSATTAGANSVAAGGAGTRPYGQPGQYGQTGYANTGTGYPANTYGAAPQGYQTGPYNTGSTGAYPPSANGYASAPTGGTATGPYQSPYQASQTATSGYGTNSGYNTADARGGAAYNGASYNGGSGAAAPQTWNQNPYGTAPATTPYGAQPTGTSGYGSAPATNYPQSTTPYGASSSGGYPQPATYQQNPLGAMPTANQAYASDTSQATYPSAAHSSYEYPATGTQTASATSGGYRPGSTARDTGALGSQPATSGSYPTTASQSGSYGSGSQYPATGQY